MNENPTKQVLLDSGLFTQVEPQWLADSNGYCTLVNRSRGVVAVCFKTENPEKINLDNITARLFFDVGEQTYASIGWYSVEEINDWVLPVLRSDKAWEFYSRDAYCF